MRKVEIPSALDETAAIFVSQSSSVRRTNSPRPGGYATRKVRFRSAFVWYKPNSGRAFKDVRSSFCFLGGEPEIAMLPDRGYGFFNRIDAMRDREIHITGQLTAFLQHAALGPLD